MLLSLVICFLQGGNIAQQDDWILLPIVLVGFAYAIFESSIWPSVVYIVPEKLLGTAYGLPTIFSGFSGVMIPLVIAELQSL